MDGFETSSVPDASDRKWWPLRRAKMERDKIENSTKGVNRDERSAKRLVNEFIKGEFYQVQLMLSFLSDLKLSITVEIYSMNSV